MKRSAINSVIRRARSAFEAGGWALPPDPVWEVTDFGLGELYKWGLVQVLLASREDLRETLLFGLEGMVIPAHTHETRRVEFVCRAGVMAVQVWKGHPAETTGDPFTLLINNVEEHVTSGDFLALEPGERITLVPGVFREFSPATPEAVVSEISVPGAPEAGNRYAREEITERPPIEEDEWPVAPLIGDRDA